jgi:hypothetical protein
MQASDALNYLQTQLLRPKPLSMLLTLVKIRIGVKGRGKGKMVVLLRWCLRASQLLCKPFFIAIKLVCVCVVSGLLFSL